jgi:hypothetical protein
MWDFQHAPSRVAEGHPSQHVQQMDDSGPQPIGPSSDTMLEIGLGLTLTCWKSHIVWVLRRCVIYKVEGKPQLLS